MELTQIERKRKKKPLFLLSKNTNRQLLKYNTNETCSPKISKEIK